MSKIEVNTIDVQCGSTLTVGSSGKTVSLASGASQTGFGRTGTVDWCTTAKTTPFTAVSGDGFFVNTTSGGITVTLPSSPSAGDIVAFSDYANTWDCNALTLCRNGSKINGVCQNENLTTEGSAITLIYVDDTRGWKQVNDATLNVSGNPGFIAATGGTVTTSGDFKIHTFTSDGCFSVSNTFGSGVGAKVSYLVVAGGGGAPGMKTTPSPCKGEGGGGAGGFREGKQACAGYTASPLAATPCSGLSVSVQTFPISVGAGGGGGTAPGNGTSGSNSIFSTITSAGGGVGGSGSNPPISGAAGGSGGGAGRSPSGPGAGNTPPTTPAQGSAGGDTSGPQPNLGGGGGGATGAGASGPTGTGGTGATSSINATPTVRATGGAGGAGGANPGSAGAANTGNGGQASLGPGLGPGQANGGAGGSGVVIIRYKFQ